MIDIKLSKIYEKFDTNYVCTGFSRISGGLINDSFLVSTDGPEFVLQKLNGDVFQNPLLVIENKILVTQHLKNLKNELSKVFLIPLTEGLYYYKNEDGSYWTLMNYISESVTFDTAINDQIAFEAGKLYGGFIKDCDTISIQTIHESFPQFHDLDLRVEQFKSALKKTRVKIDTYLESEIDFIKKIYSELLPFRKAIKTGNFKKRIVHNDTKISNVLFDKNHKGLCVIDLDTVMPGYVHFDYGDSVRTICSSVSEDCRAYEKINLNIERLQSFTNGFFEDLKEDLNKKEKTHLANSIQYMTLIMAFRFLTDHLNGNTYFKVEYPTHNLTRFKNQVILLKDIIRNLTVIESIIAKATR